jgi:hypothetical protein
MMKKALLWGAALCAALCAMLLFAGCPEEEDEPPPPFTLTVTGLETLEAGKIWGASLLKAEDIDHPFATGGLPINGTYTFYHPGSDGRSPNYSKPFNTHGNYFVALAKVDFSTLQEEEIYFYEESDSRKLVSFPRSAPLPRDAFVLKED